MLSMWEGKVGWRPGRRLCEYGWGQGEKIGLYRIEEFELEVFERAAAVYDAYVTRCRRLRLATLLYLPHMVEPDLREHVRGISATFVLMSRLYIAMATCSKT